QGAGLIVVDTLAVFFRSGDIPLGQAVPAEAGQVHQVDILDVLAFVQVSQQPPEHSGFDLGALVHCRSTPVQTWAPARAAPLGQAMIGNRGYRLNSGAVLTLPGKPALCR